MQKTEKITLNGKTYELIEQKNKFQRICGTCDLFVDDCLTITNGLCCKGIHARKHWKEIKPKHTTTNKIIIAFADWCFI